MISSAQQVRRPRRLQRRIPPHQEVNMISREHPAQEVVPQTNTTSQALMANVKDTTTSDSSPEQPPPYYNDIESQEAGDALPACPTQARHNHSSITKQRRLLNEPINASPQAALPAPAPALPTTGCRSRRSGGKVAILFICQFLGIIGLVTSNFILSKSLGDRGQRTYADPPLSTCNSAGVKWQKGIYIGLLVGWVISSCYMSFVIKCPCGNTTCKKRTGGSGMLLSLFAVLMVVLFATASMIYADGCYSSR